jgi:hypothetical protein
MLIKRISNLTGNENVRDIPAEPKDIFSWEAGEGSVSELMPYLNQEDRDFIATGITKEEWNALFKQKILQE